VGPGVTVGERFRIERKAGAGAMGVVYRAIDLSSGAPVALKVMQGDNDEQARFAREARVLATLEHPAIVRYVTHGLTEKGAPFLAMQWLEGEDLARRLARGPLETAHALALARRVADALSTLHEKGIVHRDLKPSNLLLPDGDPTRATLLDFGIARVLHGSVVMTADGAVLGTPGYMAPEQARGRDTVDARADVFALGCILAECLSGRRVFAGVDVVAILLKIVLEEPLRLCEIVPGIPAPIDDLVARMLQKNPEWRPANGATVRDEIDRIAVAVHEVESRSAARPPSLSRGERSMVTVVIAETPPLGPVQRTEALSSTDIQGSCAIEADAFAATLATDPGRALVADLAARFHAQFEYLAEGILVATLTGAHAATDQAAHAARSALAIRRAFPRAPIAVATDRALLTGRLPIGPVIDKAVKMVREAGEGRAFGEATIHLDDVTAGLVPSRFQLRPCSGGALLLGEEDATDVPRTLLGQATPFVGRDQELGTLLGLFRHVENDGVARAAIVTGPPGFGKSRLRAELVRGLRGQDALPQMWIGVGEAIGAQSPLGALARALRMALDLTGAPSADVALERVRSYVDDLFGEADGTHVRSFLEEVLGLRPVGDRAGREDPHARAGLMQRAFVELIERATVRRTVVLLFEDAHWVDAATLKLVDAALRELTDRPLLVVAFGRPDMNETHPGLWAERGAMRMALPPLAARASERLVLRVLGPKASDVLVRRLVQQAGGNPFYLEELLRAVASGAGEEHLPATVLAMVQKRVEALDAESRRLLRAASVFGSVFWAGGAAALLGLPAEEAVDDGLASLVSRELLVRQRETTLAGQTEYAFRHALVRESAYLMLTDGDRSLAHTLAAGWLEAAGIQSPAVLAEHLERGGEMDRAIEKYLEAVVHAMQASDLDAVVRMATHALSMNAVGVARGRLHLHRADALRWRGEMEVSYADAQSALDDLPEESGDWYRALAGAIAAAASAGKLDRSIELARRFFDAGGDHAARSMAIAQSATYLLTAGEDTIADALLAIVDGGERGEDPLLTARVALAHAVRAHLRGDAMRAADGMLRAAEHFQNAGDSSSATAARANAGLILSFLGRLEQAEALLNESLAMASKNGALNTVAWIKQSLAVVHANLDRAAVGLALAREAAATAHAQTDRRLEAKSRIAEANILVVLGEAADAECAARSALELADGPTGVRAAALAALASALVLAGRGPEAHGAATDAARLMADGVALEEAEADVRLAHAESLWAIGDGVAARSVIETAKASLLERASALTAPDRTAFLGRVRVHARILRLADEWRA
jgi:eukaryotic-like serine/threonine-protein kinase